MVTNKILAMLEGCATNSRMFPPTIMYNESWLLRIILDWFSTHEVPDHPLTFLDGARWFSEAALPSQFLKNPRGAKLAEGWSHADGVIGHFCIGKGHKIDLSFCSGGKQFVVLEAKMFSPLESKTSNINYYDQAARLVACIAETFARVPCSPSELSKLGFYVLAPASVIDQAIFERQMKHESIEAKVERRVREYVEAGDELKSDWFIEWFRPTLKRIVLGTLKWEDVIQVIKINDLVAGKAIGMFYNRCLEFGKQESISL